MAEESLNLDVFLHSINRKRLFSNLPSRFICVICEDLMVDPVQIICGCRYCKNCAEHYFSCNDTCKVCHEKTPELGLLYDRAFNKEIMELQTNCPNKPCKIEFSLKDLDHHLLNCDYRLIDCPNCYKMIPFISLEHHKLECPYRQLPCKFCGKIFTLDELNEIHLNKNSDPSKICDNWMILCPWNCKLTDEAVNVKNHINVCRNISINCNFSDIGCKFHGNNYEMDKHLNDSLVYHMSLLNESRKEQLIINMNLKKEINDLRSEITVLKSRKQLPENEMSEEAVRPVLANHNYQDNNSLKLQKFQWQVDNFSDHLAKSKNLKGIRSENIENNCYILTSQSFLTQKTRGYKIKLKIKFPSFESYNDYSKELYLSIYFIILRGDHDEAMVWPFNYIFNFELFSNSSTIPNRKRRLLPSDNLSCVGRPQFQQNNPAGIAKFVDIKSDINKYIQADGSITIKATWSENS